MKCIGRNEFEGTQKTNVKSGFPELDKITNCWYNSNLIVIGSRPAMGKTTFGLSLLKEIAVKNRIPTAFFSLKLPNQLLIKRFLSTLSQVDTMKIRDYDNGNLNALNEEEKRRVDDAEKQLENSPVYLDDTPGLSIQKLWQKSARLVSDFQIKLIIVDYLQLMYDSRFSNRTEEVNRIVRKLKTLAKTLNILVIAFSQLHPRINVKRREEIDGIRPKTSDLLESAIEQDADVVCFIHRPEYYKIYTDANGNNLHGLAEIIVAKNKNGETGIIRLKLNKEYASFDNLNE